MDRRERFEDMIEALRLAIEGAQAEIWTSLPGIVQSYDPDAQTVAVQPAIKVRAFSPDEDPPLPGAVLELNNWWTVTLPVIVDVPVAFPNGGGFSMTFPIQAGDECMLIFSCRPIDNWWAQGGVQKAGLSFMHDLSDAVAFFGPRSQPRRLANVDPANVEIRTDAGDVKIEVTPTDINITATGKVTLNAPEVDVANGGAVNTLVNQLFKATFDGHIHTGVTGGAGTSGPPQTAMPGSNLTTVLKAS